MSLVTMTSIVSAYYDITIQELLYVHVANYTCTCVALSALLSSCRSVHSAVCGPVVCKFALHGSLSLNDLGAPYSCSL